MTGKWLVLSFDPGQTTGYAVMGIYATPPTQLANKQVSHSLFDPLTVAFMSTGTLTMDEVPAFVQETCRRAHTGYFGAFERVAVVVEDFIVTRLAMQSNATWSSEVTGMIRAVTQLELPDSRWENTQRPVEMKNLIQKSGVLKELGLTQGGPHIRDAVGHALLFATRYRNGHVKSG